MFHANAWGMAHCRSGRRGQVGSSTRAPSSLIRSHELLSAEGGSPVTAGVPTVWIGLADALAARGERLPRCATSSRVAANRHGASSSATPTTSVSASSRPGDDRDITACLDGVAQHRMAEWPEDATTSAARTQAGLPIPGVEISIRDVKNEEIAFDRRDHGRPPRPGSLGGRVVPSRPGRGELHRRRLVPYRDMAIGSKDGYFVHRRPLEGPHQVRRRVDLLGRHGGGDHGDTRREPKLRSSPFRTPSGSSDRSPAS